jgi:membrane associated rhomboid family serine protease
MTYTTQSPGERIKSFFKSNSGLPKLLLINIAVWLIIYLGREIAFLYSASGNETELRWIENVQLWLAIPASVPNFLARPWTIITYMFLHIEFWHLLFNMLWLYWFGKIFLEFLNSRQLLTAYLLGGIAGGLVFMAAYNIFPVFQSGLVQALALGASASVLAVVIMISFMVPDYVVNLMFIGKLKIKYIAIIMMATDILMIRSGNAGGHFAHLGGALWGISYALLIRKGFDPSRVLDIFSKGSVKTGYSRPKKVKFKKVHTSNRPLTDEEYNAQRADNQKKIDTILDKIAKSGYATLSKEEKEFLFKSSKK